MTDAVRPCPKCGACDRSPRGACNPCNRNYVKQWKAVNREKVIAYRSDPARMAAANARASAMYASDPERRRISNEKSAQWRAENPGEKRAANAKWKAENPDRLKSLNSAYRARKRGNGGKLSIDIVKKLFVLQRGLCPCCRQPLGDDYHLDHKIPLSRGGANTDENVQLLRQRCNIQKGAKDPIEFMQSRGFLI